MSFMSWTTIGYKSLGTKDSTLINSSCSVQMAHSRPTMTSNRVVTIVFFALLCDLLAFTMPVSLLISITSPIC